MLAYPVRSRLPLLVAALAIVSVQYCGARPKGSPEAGIASVLRERGLVVQHAALLGGAVGVTPTVTRAVVIASEGNEPSDVYLVRVRLAPNGAVLNVGETWNVSRTSSVSERLLGSEDGRFAFAAEGSDLLNVMDLRGSMMPGEFSTLERFQTRFSAWQDVGQSQGILHRTIALPSRAEVTSLGWREDESLGVGFADGSTLVASFSGSSQLATETLEVARPQGLVPWAVDRLRSASWFGDERMQWLKAVAFTARDVLPTSAAPEESFAPEEPDGGAPSPHTVADAGAPSLVHTTPFPPKPLEALLTPALKNEGVWVSQEGDPFIRPSASSAFAMTYVRSDKQRPETRIVITLWDPTRIALHMVAGTMEPRSATGQVGTGVIPREQFPALVAGFNGGFQAVHGEFGMQVDQTLLLPPKPYGATVMELTSGETAFGTWPPSETAVPKDIRSFRQNMTALVDGPSASGNEPVIVNPWGRTWWGGTPPGWADNIHTTRSGICITKEGFVGYFYGVDVSPDALGRGMVQARCAYGMHLDMNPGLCGFEFYRAGELPPLGRPLDGAWEAEGKIARAPLRSEEEASPVQFRSRRMLRYMGHINFPQYIHRAARDFFYLTERPAAQMSAHVEDGQSVTELSGAWVPSHKEGALQFSGGDEGPVGLVIGPDGFELQEGASAFLARGVTTLPGGRKSKAVYTQACVEGGRLQLVVLTKGVQKSCNHSIFIKNLEIANRTTAESGGRAIGPAGSQLRFQTPLVPREVWQPLQQRKR